MSQRQSKLPEHILNEIAAYTSSSYRETVERGYTCFSVAVPRETIIATQRSLVDNGMSIQELMSHVFRMIAEKNPLFTPVFQYARLNPVRTGNEYVILNENSIYALIEAARREDENALSEGRDVTAEYDRTSPMSSFDKKTVKAPLLNFKTYKPDDFLKRMVMDEIVKLKTKAAHSEMQELVARMDGDSDDDDGVSNKKKKTSAKKTK
jgi:hypothetical protein